MKNDMNMHMDHAVVWVDDIVKTSEFLRDIVGLREHPMEIGVSDDDPTTGGMEGVFFDGNGIWLELVQPVGPGALMDTLNEKGDGYLGEICIGVSDLKAYNAKTASKGIQMLNIDGSPLDDENCVLHPHGEKMAYFPSEISCGMTVEIVQPGPEDTRCLPPRSYPPSWS